MTNYEWLTRNKADLVKNAVAKSIGLKNGTPNLCACTICSDCEFVICNTCHECAKRWLDEEHKPLYKKGDIVVGPCNELLVVKEVDPEEDTVAVSSYVNCGVCVSTVPIVDIKKKVGHIDESEEME